MSSQHELTRRAFVQSSVAAIAGGTVLTNGELVGQERQPAGGKRPVIISSANGAKDVNHKSCLGVAMDLLRGGADPLDAVIAGVNIVEDDPTDHSVGLGGIPNEDGVVELDASVMHGPTHKAGAVASIRNIQNPSKVARLVMQRSDHVLIVGEGALRFAKAHGFKEVNLLTDEAREEWLKWKEGHSTEDDWLSDAEAVGAVGKTAAAKPWIQTYGTINCCAVTAAGDIAGVTTTSGLGFKIPGRVGDSPIIGAGLYVDNEVGAAGSTGRGEANLQNCSSFLVVELMRQGRSPEEACLEVLKRIEKHSEPRLKDERGRITFDLKLYAVAKDGRYGSASTWSGSKFAVHDGTEARLVECGRFLYERDAKSSG